MAKRPRGSSWRRVSAGHAARFEELVQRALDTIPDPFSRALEEVAIVIADEPSRQQRLDSGLRRGEGLYGLYEGMPRSEYGADWAFEPNKITLFQSALMDDFPDRSNSSTRCGSRSCTNWRTTSASPTSGCTSWAWTEGAPGEWRTGRVARPRKLLFANTSGTKRGAGAESHGWPSGTQILIPPTLKALVQARSPGSRDLGSASLLA